MIKATDNDTLQHDVDTLLASQLAQWPDAAARYRRLSSALIRTLTLRGGTFELIHLPDRAVSTCAPTDARSIARRPCFLCEANRPAEQTRLPLPDTGLEIPVNPFPIYPKHLTLPSLEHEPQAYTQSLLERMLAISRRLREFTVFYNGPHSGASAPDHLHLQAVSPAALSQITPGNESDGIRMLKKRDGVRLYFQPGLTSRPVTASGTDIAKVAAMMTKALSLLPIRHGDTEPRVNMYATYCGQSEEAALTAILRDRHRPSCYGDDGVVFSPGAIDMGGRIVLPRKRDFDTLTPTQLQSMIDEVLLPEETFNRFILDCISHPL